METSRKSESKAFKEIGKLRNRNTLCVSEHPLFIGAREKENETEKKTPWQTRTLCLRHGEKFHWKNRCARCHYLIRFQARRAG
jgi:hypothetical protein